MLATAEKIRDLLDDHSVDEQVQLLSAGLGSLVAAMCEGLPDEDRLGLKLAIHEYLGKHMEMGAAAVDIPVPVVGDASDIVDPDRGSRDDAVPGG